MLSLSPTKLEPPFKCIQLRLEIGSFYTCNIILMINCITISFYDTLDLLIYALYIVPHKYKKCMLYKDEHLSPNNRMWTSQLLTINNVEVKASLQFNTIELEFAHLIEEGK